jgi:hypothetical protein
MWLFSKALSKDVQLMRTMVLKFKDDPTRSHTAALFERMYKDLDKTVRRCDEHRKWGRSFGQLGAAATAASSAVAGTTLASPASGPVATGIGVAAAVCGVLGSIVVALKLGQSVRNNELDHAQYLAIFRAIGSYVATAFATDEPAAIQTQMNGFAAQIGDVERARSGRE